MNTYLFLSQNAFFYRCDVRGSLA